MKIKNELYKISRKLNKTAGILGDIEVLSSGSPEKIAKRLINRTKNKIIYGAANKISRKTRRR